MAITPEEAAARKVLGQTISRIRTARGLSLQQFRDLLVGHGLSVTPQTLGNWENGVTGPGPSAMAVLERALGRPGLGLVAGIDTGLLGDLLERVEALEAAMRVIAPDTDDYGLAAYEGDPDTQTVTDEGDRPKPPPDDIEPA